MGRDTAGFCYPEAGGEERDRGRHRRLVPLAYSALQVPAVRYVRGAAQDIDGEDTEIRTAGEGAQLTTPCHCERSNPDRDCFVAIASRNDSVLVMTDATRLRPSAPEYLWNNADALAHSLPTGPSDRASCRAPLPPASLPSPATQCSDGDRPRGPCRRCPRGP